MSINYPAGSAAYGVFPYAAPHGSQQLAQLNALDYWQHNDANDAGLMINRALGFGAARYPAGFRLYLPADSYLVTTPIAGAPAGTQIVGDGRQSTQLIASPSFAGAAIVNLTADLCGVRDLSIIGGLSTSSAANPSAKGILVSGARYATILDTDFLYVNGYGVEIADSGTAAPFGAMLARLHMLHTAGGVHTIGASARNYGIQAWMTDLNLEICDSLDCLFIEDSADVLIQNINGAAAQGGATNSMLHIKGASSSVFIVNPDLGVYPGPASAPVVLIESGPNGSPSGVEFTPGVVQGGTTPFSITSGGDVRFTGVTFKRGNADGADVSGLTGELSFQGCTWKVNGLGGGTCYDLNITAASNWVNIRDCAFETPVGAGAGFITNPVNDTNHHGYFFGCHFNGSGTTPSNVFASVPQIVRSCPGYNPRGNITAPTIGASPFTTNTSQNDVNIIFTALGGMTALKIGGTSIGLPVANVAYHVPARQSVEVDWATTAPTWLWIAD